MSLRRLCPGHCSPGRCIRMPGGYSRHAWRSAVWTRGSTFVRHHGRRRGRLLGTRKASVEVSRMMDAFRTYALGCLVSFVVLRASHITESVVFTLYVVIVGRAEGWEASISFCCIVMWFATRCQSVLPRPPSLSMGIAIASPDMGLAWCKSCKDKQ